MKKQLKLIFCFLVWILISNFSLEAQEDTDTIPLFRASNNTYVPNAVIIDRTKAVGEIPMTSSVSPSGAVGYNVPIGVYPGVRGMQPQLSIAYNSHSGNGILGTGWQIAGLSSISRGNRSIYYDGKPNGIARTKDDAIYLDGVRLIKLSETVNQIKYESEQGNIKATATLNGSVIRYFEVFYPNGTKGVYGYTTNISTDYLEYPLTTFSDLQKNSITYAYTLIDNHYRINKISYANSSVEFQYTTTNRPDIISIYSGGLKVTEDRLLQKIICKYGSTVLWNYNLSYSVQKNVSLLTEIGYSASNGSAFNPLKFYYGENNTASTYTKKTTNLIDWYNWTNVDQVTTRKGKFQYGSEEDGIIVLSNNNPYYNTDSEDIGNFENLYTGKEKIFLYTDLSSGYPYPMPSLTTETGFIDILCANTDGVYEEELIKINNVVSGSNDQVVLTTYFSNLYSGLSVKHTRTFNLPTVLVNKKGLKSVHPKYYFTGDFTGDGKMKVLAVSANNPGGFTGKPTKCYLFDLESNSKLYEGQPFAFNVAFFGVRQNNSDVINQNSDRLFIIDYDGDGKSDLCLINSQGTYIYTFDVTGSTCSMRLVATYTGLKRGDLDGRLLMAGEFNGDGKTDFLLSPKINNSDWNIYYSMGNGMFDKLSTSIATRSPTYKYFLQDVNSDGLTDLIEYTTDQFGTYRAISRGFTAREYLTSFSQSNTLLISSENSSRHPFHQLIALKGGVATCFSYPRNDTKEKLLTGSVSSYGVVNKNYYRTLNESPGFYFRGYDATYPHENFTGSLFATESREQYINGQKTENISYSYNNAVIHKQGLGFRGFEKITTYDQVRGRTAVQKFDPYNFCVLKEDDSPVSKRTYTYSISVGTNKIAKLRLTGTSALDKLKNASITSSYTYDTYGYPLTETVNFGGGITETVSNTYSNNTNESGYLLGFLTNSVKTTNRNGSTWSYRGNISSHSNGLPLVVVRYANGNQVLYEKFAYDAAGNPTSKAVKKYSSGNTLETTYVYDSYGRMRKEKDPLGITGTYEYDTNTGSLYESINHKGQKTNYGYDAFYRNIWYHYPDGTDGTTDYTWNNSSINGLYLIKKWEAGKPWSKTYYDALGRETASTGLNFDYSEPRVEKQYDNFGRISKISLPYNGSVASLWNTYQYDAYDRPVAVNEASGRKTSYLYSGNSVSITSDGISYKQTFDTQGNVTSVADPAGTITYNLRPDGQPASIVAPGNVTTSFTYDIYGRRLSIIDPSAGTQSFSYDLDGNLASEMDANNKTISYSYDKYLRLITKKQPEFTTSYGYNSDGLLASESSTNGTSTSYTYDALGRLSKEKESIVDGKWLEKTYAYANSYLQSIQYSSQSGSIVKENFYYDAGHLKEIKLNESTSIWKLAAVNPAGQTTKTTTGSIARSYGYDSYGIQTNRTAGSFQNTTYTFDAAKGNLSARKDNVKNKQESFTYDNLNRLVSYEGTKTVGYDIKGNISLRSDLGIYQYNTSGKPYALSGIGITSNEFPVNSQAVTYTSFKRPASIVEGIYAANFTYNGSGQRVKMELKKSNAKELNRYYLSGCYEIDDRALGGFKEKLYLGGDFYSAPAVYVKDGNGAWQVYYICRDHLGSITHITNSSGSVVQELSYDVWGKLRNPASHAVYAYNGEPDLFLGRGYTGHEHLPMFGLVNMNARLYDLVLGRFLSADPYVQAPWMSQSFNRYSYCLNNPLRYTDPYGEIVWWLAAAIVYGAFFTDMGYDLQKTILPAAVKIDLRFGNHQGGIGIDASVGIPQISPISYRVHGGATYFWKNEDLMGNNMSGWETRYGAEWGISGYMFGVPLAYTYGGTTFNSKWSGKQTTNLQTLGNPFINLKYENDMIPEGPWKYIPFVPKGDGDRYRTAAAEINFLGLGFGTKMITGDAGSDRSEDGHWKYINGKKTYIGYDDYNPNSHRMGIFYFKAGPLRFGKNSENTRKIFQNEFAHDKLTKGKSLWFEVLDLKPRWYWEFGYSGGGTLY